MPSINPSLLTNSNKLRFTPLERKLTPGCVKRQAEEPTGNSPLELDMIMSGWEGEVAIWVTHPP